MADKLEALLAATPAAIARIEAEGTEYVLRPVSLRRILELLHPHPCLRKALFGYAPGRDMPFAMTDEELDEALPLAAKDFVVASLGRLPSPEHFFKVFQAALAITVPGDLDAFFRPRQAHPPSSRKDSGYFYADPLVVTVTRAKELQIAGHADPWSLSLHQLFYDASVLDEMNLRDMARAASAATVPHMAEADRKAFWSDLQ